MPDIKTDNQMNFIEKFFGVNSSVLSERLEQSGFSTEQARSFLPEAASAILKAFKHKEIEQIIAALETEVPEKLLNAVNINEIAKHTGINSDQVTSGFEAIAPLMAKAFRKYSGGIVGAAASVAWGNTGDFLNLKQSISK